MNCECKIKEELTMSEDIFEAAEIDEDLDKGFACKDCPAIVSEQVCIQADIKIFPKVKVGKIMTFCDEPIFGKCARVTCSNEPCEFTVSRNICVQIPLIFSAETFVHPAGHVCGIPETAPCHACID